MEGKKILIVDDDYSLCDLMRHTCEKAGATALTAFDGKDGLRLFFENRPDLVILDVCLPGIDGWEICQQIRLMADTPIIMLTTLGNDVDVIRGLDLGANDYVTKPFSRTVLLARIRAALRQPAPAGEAELCYQDDHLAVNLPERRVAVAGQLVHLSDTEFKLLTYLFKNAGRVLTYDQILSRIWGWESGSSDYVHVYVSHLRRKLEQNPRQPCYILTEHRVGYRFQKANAIVTAA